MRFRSLVVLLCLTLVGVLHASPNAPALTGTVSDATGAPLPGVTVTISTADGPPLTTRSGPDGRFRVAVLAAGSYNAHFDLPGFDRVTTTFTVEEGRPVALAVVLKVGSVAESVTVTGRTPTLNAHLGFASSVAELGLLLRQSTHRGAASIDRLIERARRFRGADPHNDRGEFIALARRAGTLIEQSKAGQPSQ